MQGVQASHRPQPAIMPPRVRLARKLPSDSTGALILEDIAGDVHAYVVCGDLRAEMAIKQGHLNCVL